MQHLSHLWSSIVRFFVQNPRLGQLLFIGSALAVAVVIATYLLTGYLKELTANRIWIEDVKVLPQDRMLRVIFDRSVEAGLIWPEINSQGVRINVVSCENLRDGLPGEGIAPRGDVAQNNKEALSLLCTTDQGAQVREEIRQWNDSEYLLAVRDNRRKPVATPGRQVNLTCDPPRPDRRKTTQTKPPLVAHATIPRRCLLNRWDMFVLAGERDSGFKPIPIEPRGPEPSATGYDFIANDNPLYMTDWASVIPAGFVGPTRDVDYRLASTIPLPNDGRLRIDVVGTARRVAIRSAGIDLDLTRLDSRRPVVAAGGEIDVSVSARCDLRQVPSRECTNAAPGVPYAYIIEVRGPAGRAIAVEIDARLQRNIPRGILAALRRRDVLPKPAPASPAGAQDTSDDDNEEEEDDDVVETWDVGTRTPNLIVECPDDLPEGVTTSCTVSWRIPDEEAEDDDAESRANEQQEAKAAEDRTRQDPRRTAPTYRVQPADQDVNLVTPESGEFTPASLELGLAPVVGGGASQWGSMAWALRGGKGAVRSAALTINLREQQIIRDVLEERRMRCVGAAPPKDCVFRNPSARAVIAVIDASKERAGEVRAMVSWPPGQTGAHVWDVAASSGGSGRRWRGTATAKTAWSVGYDGLSQPGSTFKVVTALAAAEAALKRQNPDAEKIQRLLEGNMSLLDGIEFLNLRQRIKVSENDRARDCRVVAGPPYTRDANMLYVPRHTPGLFKCLQNFESLGHLAYQAPPAVSGCPPGRSAGPGAGQAQLGLCEALMRSSNLFFGGLSFKLDGSKVMQGSQERDGPVKNLDLEAMADRLLPPSPNDQSGYDLMRGSLPRPAALLRLDRRPITIEAANPPGKAPDRRVMTTTSGYGQNVYAAPLAMAAIYASLATRSVVRPRLVPRTAIPAQAPADVNTPILQAGTEEERDRYLGILRAGLHGVVAKPGGSARSYFAPVTPRRGAALEAVGRSALLTTGNQPRLFGKTGTATISTRFNTLWFAGWIEGDSKRGIKTPLAFVCQAIQQPRGQKLTGGSVCAPIIRDILLRLDQTASERVEPTRATKGPPAGTRQKGQPR